MIICRVFTDLCFNGSFGRPRLPGRLVAAAVPSLRMRGSFIWGHSLSGKYDQICSKVPEESGELCFWKGHGPEERVAPATDACGARLLCEPEGYTLLHSREYHRWNNIVRPIAILSHSFSAGCRRAEETLCRREAIATRPNTTDVERGWGEQGGVAIWRLPRVVEL